LKHVIEHIIYICVVFTSLFYFQKDILYSLLIHIFIIFVQNQCAGIYNLLN